MDEHRARFYKNRCFDDVYEDWWEKEGSKSFEDYLKKDKDDAKGKEEE
jgi:hypothetical protein